MLNAEAREQAEEETKIRVETYELTRELTFPLHRR